MSEIRSNVGPWRRARLWLVVLIAGLSAFSGHARAEPRNPAPAPDERTPDERTIDISRPRPAYGYSLGAYGAEWTDIRFTSIPRDLIEGRARFEDSQIAALTVNRPLTDFTVAVPLTRYRLKGFSLEGEGQVIKHFGLEDHWEVTGSVLVRTGEFPLPFGQSLNLAWGNGLSYALSPPAYERGRAGGPRGVDAPQLLWHMSLEADVTARSRPNLSLFLRVHHRSGVYSQLAPRGTGSNFLGAGFRIRFP